MATSGLEALVFGVVRDAVARVLEVDAGTITPATTFGADLGADSLALVEVAELVEEALVGRSPGFRLEDEVLERLVTVGEAVRYTLERLR